MTPERLDASTSRFHAEREPPPPTDQETSAAQREKLRTSAQVRISRRYLQVADVYHLKNEVNTPAFADKGDRMKALVMDPDVARSMVDLAVAKGWSRIKVTGAPEFRETVWMYARAQNIDVDGHVPSPVEAAKLQQLRRDVGDVVTEGVPSTASGAADGMRATQPDLNRNVDRAIALLERALRSRSARYPTGHTAAQVAAVLSQVRQRWRSDETKQLKLNLSRTDVDPQSTTFEQPSNSRGRGKSRSGLR